MHVAVDHITKVFGKVRANDDISMALDRGHIYAVLGENGAGKSTLMKILSGYQPPDSGQLLLDGKSVHFSTPADALRMGIGMLHQDVLDVPRLTVLENFILGRADRLIPDWQRAKTALLEGTSRLGFVLHPDAYVDNLTIGERQQLEIVRLLNRGAKVLILDEPTTGISADQKDTLFASLQRLAHEDGITVILVSHKLEDVEALCDHLFVLRHGKFAGESSLPCPRERMIEMMFGKELARTPREPMQQYAPTVPVLSVKALTVTDRRVSMKEVYLDVRPGEVIGLAGLEGSGQQPFLRACAGLQRPTSGEILLDGHDITHMTYHDVAALGVAYAPAGRLEEGLVAGLTLAEHFALVAPHSAWIDWPGVRNFSQERIAHYSIQGRPDSRIENLSGGNQQRTLLALLPPTLKLLLLESPTRGLDVESTQWVWQQLLERRAQGTAILFLSSDLDEIIDYSDRVVVFYGGRTTLIDDPASTGLSGLGYLIGGGTQGG